MPTSSTTPIYQPDRTPGATPDYTRTIRDLQDAVQALQVATGTVAGGTTGPTLTQAQTATVFNESGTATTPYYIDPTVTLLVLNTGPGPVPGTGDFYLPPVASVTGPVTIYSGAGSIWNINTQAGDQIENVDVNAGGVTYVSRITGFGVVSGVAAVWFWPKAGATGTWVLQDYL